MKQHIYQFLEQPATPAAKLVRRAIVILIMISGVIIYIEFAHNNFFVQHHNVFYNLELAIVLIFTAEYLLRLWAAPSRWKFIFNFYNVIDLLAIIPFYFHILNSSIFRSVRLLRLARISKLFRLTRLFRFAWLKRANTVSRVVQENVIKNLVVIIALYVMAHPTQEFFQAVPVAVLPDILLAVSVLAVAAMFGFFRYRMVNSNHTIRLIDF